MKEHRKREKDRARFRDKGKGIRIKRGIKKE
jgi:hypothetical protein